MPFHICERIFLSDPKGSDFSYIIRRRLQLPIAAFCFGVRFYFALGNVPIFCSRCAFRPVLGWHGKQRQAIFKCRAIFPRLPRSGSFIASWFKHARSRLTEPRILLGKSNLVRSTLGVRISFQPGDALMGMLCAAGNRPPFSSQPPYRAGGMWAQEIRFASMWYRGSITEYYGIRRPTDMGMG